MESTPSWFGLGARGADTARAHQIGGTKGAVSGLVMAPIGVLDVLAAPLVAHALRQRKRNGR